MVDTNYYTPGIEEFYIGFEYEFKDYLDDIDKTLFKWETFTIIDGDEIQDVVFQTDHNNIRVKYLDKEDRNLKYWEQEDESIIYRKNNYVIVFWKNAHKSDYKTNIYIKQETGLGMHSFKGECKNKSELKVILKQLNIK